MIALGSFDADVPETARTAYLEQVRTLTRVPMAEVVDGIDRLSFKPAAPGPGAPLTVREVQSALRQGGFFPAGVTDGICGYRTQSAIRLFQEYLRTVEGRSLVPTGRADPDTQAALQRWRDAGSAPAWAPQVAAWAAGTTGGTEYAEWLALLAAVQAKYRAAPSPVLRLVAARREPSDTRPVELWDFGPSHVHLVGIRRTEKSGKFDDIFVLLLKGLVVKLQGSTEPGASDHPAGRPFLVPGQHDYHFGWHQKKYLALRPQGPGVLVVRSTDDRFGDDDLAHGLEVNASINVHWGGRGLRADVKTWSEGCQVINGSVYLDFRGTLVSCAAFAALNQQEVNTPGSTRTRGAYNVLLDLVTALGSDLPPVVKYTLLDEGDLALAPALVAGLTDARQRVTALLG